LCRAAILLLPSGRRSHACRRWAGDQPQTGWRGISDKPNAQVLLPLCARSSASWTPTAFGQNQKQFVTTEIRPESKAIRHRRDASRIECDLCRAAVVLLPAGRRSLACRRWAGDQPRGSYLGRSGKPHAQVLLPVPGRSSASWTPTAFGQNQKQFVTTEIRPESNAICAAPRYRFCPQGVGALLAGDGLGTSPKAAISVGQVNRMLRFCCRFPADRQQAGLLRPAARIKSNSSPQGCVPNQMRFVPRRDTASARRA